MIRHFFLDKTDTIIKGSYLNTSLNPILELNYGKNITRGIVHFDEKELLELVADKTFTNLDKLSCHLKMTNCFSVDGLPYEKKYTKNDGVVAERATSFDIIAFKLPCSFDEGRGYDYIEDFWVSGSRSQSKQGVSWYTPKNGYVWPIDDGKLDYDDPNLNVDFSTGKIWILSGDTKIKINLEGGIYDYEFLQSEDNNFLSGLSSIVIDMQHFEFGNENLDLNITSYINDIINGEPNNGICLMFTPNQERMITEIQQYVGFFTNHTNTFFHPYIDIHYDEFIQDDRENFCIGKTNRLYLYVLDNGIPQNLDILPTCMINDVQYEVKQAQKGVYFAEIKVLKDEMIAGTIGYDIWSNLVLNGQEIDDVEMEFEIHSSSSFLKVGNMSIDKNNVVPSLYGINDAEDLHRGEVREVVTDFRKQYTTTQKELIDSAEYRLYVKDGDREIVVIDYTPIEKSFLNNFFIINTNDLVPNNYFIDIRVKQGRDIKYYKKVLRFKVVSDVTNRYE